MTLLTGENSLWKFEDAKQERFPKRSWS